MKQNQLILCMGLSAMSLFSSCMSEERDIDLSPQIESKTGKIVLSFNADASFNEQTRALDEAEWRNLSNYTVQLLQGGQEVQHWTGNPGTVNIERTISDNYDENTYEVRAFYGTEEPASRSTFLVEGAKSFNLSTNDNKTINVSCTPTCGKLVVVFDRKMADYYKNYSVSYTGIKAMNGSSINWAKDDFEPWYVKLDSRGEEITYTITVEAKDEYAHLNGETKQTTGTVTNTFNLQRNYLHKLTVVPRYEANEHGELQLSIVIDEATNDIRKTFTVPVSWI